mgnify:CR=1 FL=1
MRSRSTNFLQITVLVSGIIYVILGITFFISPLLFGWIQGMDVNEDWLKEIPKDPFIFAVYYMGRAFAAMVFSSGLAMILPLFDPLKYRGLVYYTGVIFPFMASLILLKSGIQEANAKIIILGSIFLLLLVLTTLSLAITRKKAKSGLE